MPAARNIQSGITIRPWPSGSNVGDQGEGLLFVGDKIRVPDEAGAELGSDRIRSTSRDKSTMYSAEFLGRYISFPGHRVRIDLFSKRGWDCGFGSWRRSCAGMRQLKIMGLGALVGGNLHHHRALHGQTIHQPPLCGKKKMHVFRCNRDLTTSLRSERSQQRAWDRVRRRNSFLELVRRESTDS